MLTNLSMDNVEELSERAVAVITDMERMIERGYVEQNDIVIRYRDFWVQIESVNDYPMATMATMASIDQQTALLDATDTLRLPSKIHCNELECTRLVSERDDEALSIFMTAELRSYFGNASAASETVTFRVQSMHMDILSTLPLSDDSDQTNVLFYITLGLVVCIILCAVYALCFNHGVCLRCPIVPGFGCQTVDDGNFRALIVFALHLFDFLSDINLAGEMWLNPEIAVNKLLLIVAIASAVFIVVPYCVNLYHASKMKQYVEGNECAKMHFERSAAFYSALVVFSGSCYASIGLCSSNIFGMSVFSAGLTQTELKKLKKLRISSNVVLENIPQIVVQIVYATMVIGNVNSAVVFAFVASVLSVTNTLLNYFVERERGDAINGGKQVVWYYLVMQIYEHNSGQDSISADQRKAIKCNKGRRRALISALSELLSVLRQNIEIVRTDLTKYGAIVFVSHTIYASELLLMTANAHEGNEGNGEQAPEAQLYLSRLYASHRAPVSELFRTHFAVSGDFHVRQQYKLSAVKKGIWMVNQDEKDLVDAYVEFAAADALEDASGAVEMASK